MGLHQDDAVIEIIVTLEKANQLIQAQQKSAESTLNKRALSIAITQLETSMLWLANSRP